MSETPNVLGIATILEALGGLRQRIEKVAD
jgi:hypothetical protein